MPLPELSRVSGDWIQGNLGDNKSLGGGLAELRIDYGPGYRVFFLFHGEAIIILLCGGDKHRQQQDIVRARKLAEGV